MPHSWITLEKRTQPRARNTVAQQAHEKAGPQPGRGAIRFRLHEFCQERGLVNKDGRANRDLVARMTGVSSGSIFYMLRYPKTVDRIHFPTLARLCHGLNCQPGDIMVYDRTEDSDTPLSEQYKHEGPVVPE